MREKLLPQNIEAECGVLGSIIIDPEAIVQIADFLHSRDFYRDAHRTVYEVILRLQARHQPADFITICDELERQQKLEEVGGASYLTSLINQVPTSGNVEYYAQIVVRTSVLRRLIHAAGQIASIAYEADDSDLALEQAEELILAIGQEQQRSDLVHVAEVLTEYAHELDQRHTRHGTITGVPTGFYALDCALGGLQRSDLVIVAARPGQGKCLTAGMLIDDPLTGERLTIEECVKRQLPVVQGISEEGKIQVSSVSRWIDSGVQPCFRVRTRTGRMVEVTGHHPFLTVRGWKPLHELGVGQHIAVPSRVESFGSDENWSRDLVRLLAYYIAEGGLTRTTPGFTNTDPVIVEDFKQIIGKHFPACSIRQHGISYFASQAREPYLLQGHNPPTNPVTAWLRSLGLMGKSAKEKFFPGCVWKWSRSYLAEFLRALMSCDGSIYPIRGIPTIEFTVASLRLASDLQHALLRFAILSRLSQKTQNAWRIVVYEPGNIKRYQEEIGWSGEKSKRFAGYTHVVTRRGGNTGHAPKEVWELVQAAALSRGLSLTALARDCAETTRRGKRGGYNPHLKRSLPRYRLAAYARVLDDRNLQRISSADVYWDEVVSVEPIGEQQVYDLTVPDGANFVAQDIFVHNTSLALNIARHAVYQHKRQVALFSLEMSRSQLVQRLLSLESEIDQHRLRMGWLHDADWDRIVVSIDTLSDGTLCIDDTDGLSIAALRSRARRLQARVGLDLIVVDYLQLMQATIAGKRHHNREQEIAEISRGLKGIAKELNVPVLALAQLSRAVESRTSKVPQLSDLRESGAIEADSDVVLFIYREEQPSAADAEATRGQQQTADIIIAKHRNGPVGYVRLGWEPRQTKFFNLDEASSATR